MVFKIPLWNDKVLRLYYFSEILINFWLIAPVWFFIFRHFLSVSQIGINEIIVFAVGFVAEIPSGALADSFGRRRILIIGGSLITLGAVFSGLANNLIQVIGAQSLWFIGYAFYSGANEAYIYDYLKEKHGESHFKSVCAAAKNFGIVATMISVLLGGILYNIQFRLPFMVYAVAILIFTLVVWLYPHDHKIKKSDWSFKVYLNDLVAGSKQLIGPNLKFLVVGVGLFAGFNHIYEWGVLRPMILEAQNYDGGMAAVLSFVAHIVIFVVFLFMPKLFKKDIKASQILTMTVLAAILFGLFSIKLGIIGAGILVVMYTLASKIIEWWVSVYINHHIESKSRATTLSAWSMLIKVPYIILAILVTNLSRNGLSRFIIIGSILIIFLALLSAAKTKSKA